MQLGGLEAVYPSHGSRPGVVRSASLEYAWNNPAAFLHALNMVGHDTLNIYCIMKP